MKTMYLLPLVLCLLAGAHAGNKDCMVCTYMDWPNRVGGSDCNNPDFAKTKDYFNTIFSDCEDGTKATIPDQSFDMDTYVCGVIAFKIEMISFDGMDMCTVPVIQRGNFHKDQGQGPNSKCEGIAGSNYEKSLEDFFNSGRFTYHKTCIHDMTGFFCDNKDRCNKKDCSPKDQGSNDQCDHDDSSNSGSIEENECFLCTHAYNIPGSYPSEYQAMFDYFDVDDADCKNAVASGMRTESFNMDTDVCGTICFEVKLTKHDDSYPVTFNVIQRANFKRDQGEGPTSCKDIDGTSFQEDMEMFFNTGSWPTHKTFLKKMDGCFCESPDECNDDDCT